MVQYVDGRGLQPAAAPGMRCITIHLEGEPPRQIRVIWRWRYPDIVRITRRQPDRSDVEPEVNHVAILDQVFLTFESPATGILGTILSAVRDVIESENQAIT